MRKWIVEISWRDPTTDAGWVDEDNHTKKLPILKSYGILIAITKTQVIIAGSYDPDQKKYGDRSKFPKGCVESIRNIERVKL